MAMRGTCAKIDVLAGDSGNVTGGDMGVIEGSGVELAGGPQASHRLDSECLGMPLK